MKSLIYKSRIVISILVLLLIIFAVVSYFINPTLLPQVNISKIALWFGVGLFVFFLLFGRFACSLICPFGIVQNIATMFFDRMNEKKPNWFGKYIIMVISFIIFAVAFFEYKNRPEHFASLNLPFIFAVSAGILFVGVAILSIFKDRFFCTHICPCGTFVGLISKISLFKIYIDKSKCICCGMCERSCPSFSIDACEEFIDNETCVKCLKCMGNCPKDAISIGVFQKDKK